MQSDVKYSKVSIDDVQAVGNPSFLGIIQSLMNGGAESAPADGASSSANHKDGARAGGAAGADAAGAGAAGAGAASVGVAQPASPPVAGSGTGLDTLKALPNLSLLTSAASGAQLTEEQREKATRMQAMVQAKLASLTPEQREVFEKKQAMMTKAVMAQLAAAQQGKDSSALEGGGGGADRSALAGMMVQTMLAAQQQQLSESPEQALERELLACVRSGDTERLGVLLGQHRRGANAQVRAPRDQEAHPLLHWAALNDQKEVVELLVSRGADVDQRNPRQETALHWASLNGNLRCVHLLIEHGCDRTASDGRGYSAMHHAAQFGRVVVMACLLRRGLSADVRDSNGRTPLHWAAYKGEELAVAWLLEHGADVAAEDFEECLPLHWAALQGLRSVAVVLMRYGALAFLERKDRTGGTAEQLAKEKEERHLAEEGKEAFNTRSYRAVREYLESCRVMGRDVSKDNNRSMHPTWFCWPIMAPIGFWQYYVRVLPETSFYPLLTLAFWLFYFGEWFAWARLQLKNPGNYVVRPKFARAKLNSGARLQHAASSSKGEGAEGGKAGEMRIMVGGGGGSDNVCVNPVGGVRDAALYRELYLEVLDRGLLVPVCTTCEIVKPLRSKHDRFTDVCVERFDHYCPFMGQAIGGNNYREFFFAMFNAGVAMYAWLALVVLYTGGTQPSESWLANFWAMLGWELFAWSYLPIALYATIMVAQHLMFIHRNITTNEVMNRHKYRYLHSKQNPFDRGALANWTEFLGLNDPLPVDVRQYYAFEFAGRSEQVEANNRAIAGGPQQAQKQEQELQQQQQHGHSHGGKPCHGHGQPEEPRPAVSNHGHSHGGEPCHGH